MVGEMYEDLGEGIVEGCGHYLVKEKLEALVKLVLGLNNKMIRSSSRVMVHISIRYILYTGHTEHFGSRSLESLNPLLPRLLVLPNLQLLQLPRPHIINQAMHHNAPLPHRINNHRILLQRLHTLLDIRLHQRQRPLLLPQPLPLPRILRPQFPQRHQPRINQSQFLIRQRRIRTPTARMSAHDQMLDLQMLHGVGDDRLRVQIAGREDVGDVAVHEDVPGLQTQHGGFGDARVGAADPEDLGLLALGEGGEEVGFGFGG